MSGPRTVVVILAALVSAGIAYAVVSTVVGSGNDSSTPPVSQVSPPSHAAPAASGPAWLGADTESVGVAGGGSTSGSGNTGGLSSGSGNTGGFSSGAGAVVTNVAPGSPADAAGLEPGDVITQINGRTVSSPNDITSVLAGMHAGQSVEIQYQRGPFADAAQVTLAARPAGTP